MTTPTVSVIVPAFNNERLLPRALDSVIEQTFTDWEIVLVDDGSVDGTPDVAARYAGRLKDRFNLIRQPNRGSSDARNRGIEASRGRFVAFLDSDDEFLPTKIDRQLKLFKLRPELGFVYSDYAFVDLNGVRHESAFDATHSTARDVPCETVEPGLHICHGNLFDYLIRAYFISTIVGLVRREVLGATIRFPTDQIFGEEWLFYLKVARACEAGFVDEPLSVYHYRQGSLARADKARNAACYRKLLKAMEVSLGHLSRGHRRVVRSNVARVERQLGYTAYRSGCYEEAVAYLGEAFRYEPSGRMLYHWLQALVRRKAARRRSVECGPRDGRGENLPKTVR